MLYYGCLSYFGPASLDRIILFFFYASISETGLGATTIYCRLKRLVVLILSHALIYDHVLMCTLSAIFSLER